MFLKNLFSSSVFFNNIKSSFSTKGEFNRLQFLTYNIHIFTFVILIQIIIGIIVPLMLLNNNPTSIQKVVAFQGNFTSILMIFSLIAGFLLFIFQSTGIIKRLHDLQLGGKTYFIIVMSVLLLLITPVFLEPNLQYRVGAAITSLFYRLNYFVLFIYFFMFILLFLPGKKVEEIEK